ncbi:MAG: PKD domain-containing protein [bacterium]|nr:PKD domain-containing protein [bacterium]
MVWDSQGSNSSWTNGSDFTTASHQYPTSNFSWSPTNPGELQTAQFTDTSQVYGGATKSAWGWTFQQGSPATSTQQNPQAQFTPVGIKQVALQITDSSGYSCQISKNVNVQVPFPDWQEISPF